MPRKWLKMLLRLPRVPWEEGKRCPAYGEVLSFAATAGPLASPAPPPQRVPRCCYGLPPLLDHPCPPHGGSPVWAGAGAAVALLRSLRCNHVPPWAPAAPGCPVPRHRPGPRWAPCGWGPRRSPAHPCPTRPGSRRGQQHPCPRRLWPPPQLVIIKPVTPAQGWKLKCLRLMATCPQIP